LSTVIEPDDVSASCNVTLEFVFDNSIGLFSVFPLLVKLQVPCNRTMPEYVHVIPAETVRLPFTLTGDVPARVPVNPVKFKLKQFAVAEIVQGPVEAASKNTSSADVGTASPPGPPEVKDHLVPAVAFQELLPPTQ
jgi:hypothetical protein